MDFITVITLSIIGTPYLLTILALKSTQLPLDVPKYIAVCMANSVDPGQTPQSVASDMGLHLLQRPICPVLRVNTVTLKAQFQIVTDNILSHLATAKL